MKAKILFIAVLSLIIVNACGGKQLSEDKTGVNVNASNIDSVPVPQNVNAEMLNMPSNSNINAQHSRSVVNSPADPNFKPKPLEVPRPYNSTMSTTMNKQNQFLETRAFKDDPQILKLERIQEAKKIKLYLKSGKVIDLPYDKAMGLFVDGAPTDFLQLAGIKPSSTPTTAVPPTKKQ